MCLERLPPMFRPMPPQPCILRTQIRARRSRGRGIPLEDLANLHSAIPTRRS
jgi:hypothetical protein